MYSGNFKAMFESNICNGACLYANKAVWQPLTNATGPCTGLNTQPQGFACPSGCATLLGLVPPDCRGIASSVTYAAYGDFLYVVCCLLTPHQNTSNTNNRQNAFRACDLTVPQVCAQAGYLGCELITNTEGTGSSSGAVVVNQGVLGGCFPWSFVSATFQQHSVFGGWANGGGAQYYIGVVSPV